MDRNKEVSLQAVSEGSSRCERDFVIRLSSERYLVALATKLFTCGVGEAQSDILFGDFHRPAMKHSSFIITSMAGVKDDVERTQRLWRCLKERGAHEQRDSDRKSKK